LRRFKKLVEQAKSITFSSDGKKIMAEFWNPQDRKDYTLHIWDVDSGKELQKLEFEEYWSGATFSSDGKKVITFTAMENLAAHRYWDIESGRELHKIAGLLNGILSPDGKKMIAGVAEMGAQKEIIHYVGIWDTDSRKELHKLKVDNFADSFAFSPDGRMVIISIRDNSVGIWSADLAHRLFEVMLLPVLSKLFSEIGLA